jgi:GT2 family glycosyltransferase
MQRIISFIYPIIRTDFVKKSILSLYAKTDNTKFNIIVVDQSIEGLDKEFIDQYVHLYIRMKNQGFSKASNEGIIHALRWQVPYISIVNDDTEFIYEGWLEDALEEFETDPHIVAINPECPKVAGWGYGLQNGEYIEIMPYKEVFTPEDIAYLKGGNYDSAEIKARHAFEIPATFPYEKRGVVDGFAGWMPIWKREGLIELGLFDERFVWGGGEDYDMLARAYSCAYPISRTECDPTHHRRMVTTMKSWVWHWWGQSKDIKEQLNPKLFEGKEPWNDNGLLWTPSFDVWGHYTESDGTKKPIRRTMTPKIEVL